MNDENGYFLMEQKLGGSDQVVLRILMYSFAARVCSRFVKTSVYFNILSDSILPF